MATLRFGTALAAGRPLIERTVRTVQPVTIYTTPFCGFCTRALRLLASKNAPVTEISRAERPEARAEMIARSGGASTFPQIFIGDVHVGGSDDLHALERRGALDALLAGTAEG